MVTVIFALVGVSAGVIFWWSVEPANTPIVNWVLDTRDKDGNAATEFKAGHFLYSHGVFEITRDIPRTLLRKIVNEDTGAIYAIFEPQFEHLKKGRYDRTFPVSIPAYLPPGHYSLRMTVLYPLNPLQPHVRVDAPVLYFTVMK